MAHKRHLLQCRLSRQPVPVNPALVRAGDREVQHAAANQIVEKMGPLARIGAHLRRGRLHDHAGPGNLAPDHRNTQPGIGAAPAPEADQQVRPPLRLQVEAASILLFGECTADSGRFRIKLDGKPVTGKWGQEKGSDLFEGNRWKNGNGFLLYEVARGLDPSVPHLLEIEPVFDDAKAQELKLESICVAGGKATVTLPQKAAEYAPR